MIEEILIIAFSFPIIRPIFVAALDYTIFFTFNKPQMYIYFTLNITVTYVG